MKKLTRIRLVCAVSIAWLLAGFCSSLLLCAAVPITPSSDQELRRQQQQARELTRINNGGHSRAHCSFSLVLPSLVLKLRPPMFAGASPATGPSGSGAAGPSGSGALQPSVLHTLLPLQPLPSISLDNYAQLQQMQGAEQQQALRLFHAQIELIEPPGRTLCH